jgi:hypothetical protein
MEATPINGKVAQHHLQQDLAFILPHLILDYYGMEAQQSQNLPILE